MLRSSGALAALSAEGLSTPVGVPLPEAVYLQPAPPPLTSNGMPPPRPSLLGAGPPEGVPPGAGPVGGGPAMHPALAAVRAAQAGAMAGAHSGSPRSPQEGLGSVGLGSAVPGMPGPGGPQQMPGVQMPGVQMPGVQLPGVQMPGSMPRMLPGVHLGGGGAVPYPTGGLGMPAGVSGPALGAPLGMQQRLWQVGAEGGGPRGMPDSPSMMPGASVSELKRLIEVRRMPCASFVSLPVS